VSEYNPQSDPTHCEALVHGVPHVAVEADYNQSPRRCDRGWCTVSRPPEVPNAAHGDSESEY
jgi:hypothetical protein